MGLSTFTSKEFGPFFVGALWLIGAGKFTVHVLYQAPLRSYEMLFDNLWPGLAYIGVKGDRTSRSASQFPIPSFESYSMVIQRFAMENHHFSIHRCSMVLVYLPLKLGDFEGKGKCWCAYSSTMVRIDKLINFQKVTQFPF